MRILVSCLSVYCVHTWYLRSEKRATDPLELEMWMVVSSSARVACAFNILNVVFNLFTANICKLASFLLICTLFYIILSSLSFFWICKFLTHCPCLFYFPSWACNNALITSNSGEDMTFLSLQFSIIVHHWGKQLLPWQGLQGHLFSLPYSIASNWGAHLSISWRRNLGNGCLPAGRQASL